jgi:hypothetical protein
MNAHAAPCALRKLAYSCEPFVVQSVHVFLASGLFARARGTRGQAGCYVLLLRF